MDYTSLLSGNNWPIGGFCLVQATAVLTETKMLIDKQRNQSRYVDGVQTNKIKLNQETLTVWLVKSNWRVIVVKVYVKIQNYWVDILDYIKTIKTTREFAIMKINKRKPYS